MTVSPNIRTYLLVFNPRLPTTLDETDIRYMYMSPKPAYLRHSLVCLVEINTKKSQYIFLTAGLEIVLRIDWMLISTSC